MKKADYIKKAKDLGCENVTEDLTIDDLKTLIDAKEAELEASAVGKLREEAEKMQLDIEDLETSEEIQEAIDIANEEEEEEDETETETETEEGIYTDKRGLKFKFKESAPKTINIDGKPMTQEEILESEDIISELAFGNSNFLIQKQ